MLFDYLINTGNKVVLLGIYSLSECVSIFETHRALIEKLDFSVSFVLHRDFNIT